MNKQIAWRIASETIAYLECPLCPQEFEDEQDLCEHLIKNHTDKEGEDLI